MLVTGVEKGGSQVQSNRFSLFRRALVCRICAVTAQVTKLNMEGSEYRRGLIFFSID